MLAPEHVRQGEHDMQVFCVDKYVVFGQFDKQVFVRVLKTDPVKQYEQVKLELHNEQFVGHWTQVLLLNTNVTVLVFN